MENNSKKEREEIAKALKALDLWFEGHDKVQTPFGEQYTINGYQLSEIYITDRFIRINVYLLDRSIQEKDCVREGDKESFLYRIKENKISLQS